MEELEDDRRKAQLLYRTSKFYLNHMNKKSAKSKMKWLISKIILIKKIYNEWSKTRMKILRMRITTILFVPYFLSYIKKKKKYTWYCITQCWGIFEFS
jgi:hypothetical protein